MDGPALDAFDEAAEFFAPARMPQFAQSFGFDLPDTFASDFEILPHFFQRMVGRLTDPESFPQDFLDRKSTRLNSSHMSESRMPSSA